MQHFSDATDYAIEDIETYKHTEQFSKEHLVFLLLATYGDGEPTDNALDFFTWLTEAAAAADDGSGRDGMLKVRLRKFL